MLATAWRKGRDEASIWRFQINESHFLTFVGGVLHEEVVVPGGDPLWGGPAGLGAHRATVPTSHVAAAGWMGRGAELSWIRGQGHKKAEEDLEA